MDARPPVPDQMSLKWTLFAMIYRSSAPSTRNLSTCVLTGTEPPEKDRDQGFFIRTRSRPYSQRFAIAILRQLKMLLAVSRCGREIPLECLRCVHRILFPTQGGRKQQPVRSHFDWKQSLPHHGGTKLVNWTVCMVSACVHEGRTYVNDFLTALRRRDLRDFRVGSKPIASFQVSSSSSSPSFSCWCTPGGNVFHLCCTTRTQINLRRGTWHTIAY